MSKQLAKKSLKLFEDDQESSLSKSKCVKKSLKFKKSVSLLELARQKRKMNHFEDNIHTLNKLSSIKLDKNFAKDILVQPKEKEESKLNSPESSVFTEKDFKKFFREFFKD
jgi:hypothetical protein